MRGSTCRAYRSDRGHDAVSAMQDFLVKAGIMRPIFVVGVAHYRDAVSVVNDLLLLLLLLLLRRRRRQSAEGGNASSRGACSPLPSWSAGTPRRRMRSWCSQGRTLMVTCVCARPRLRRRRALSEIPSPPPPPEMPRRAQRVFHALQERIQRDAAVSKRRRKDADASGGRRATDDQDVADLEQVRVYWLPQLARPHRRHAHTPADGRVSCHPTAVRGAQPKTPAVHFTSSWRPALV